MSFRSRLALIAALLWPYAAGAEAVYLQSYRWTVEDPAFGGFSGLEIGPDGRSFIALSDRGTLWRGAIARGAADEITGITATHSGLLKQSTGAPVALNSGDSEGLAQGPDGALYISFEGLARVSRFDADDAPATLLPRPEAFKQLQNNSALEALAIDAQGALYTLPERSGALSRPFPVWRLADGAWTQPFSITRDGNWLPVGADFGPDGRLYLVERDFWGLLGFLTRVRVFDLGGDLLTGEVLLQTQAGVHDNLEGISIWRDAAGLIRISLISDDNFRFFQSTEIVEYSLPAAE